ncbi:uncharacterized protein [Onthophagus taurus]|uniref:uncharacterized protein isoform X1 n=1 Tax=Onthophagus taurus TaxID=166361 RepID=UPI0039BE973D
MFNCENCGKSFTRLDNLKRHRRTACVGKRIKVNEAHSSNSVLCEICNEYVNKQCYSAHLRSNDHKRNAFTIIDDGVEEITSAFGNKITSYRITEPGKHIDISEYSYKIREKVLSLLQRVIDIHCNIKVNMECFGIYFLNSKNDVEVKSFNTKNKIITSAINVYDVYEEFVDEIKTKMSEFQERDSGWTLVEILFMEINCNEYNPTRACSFIDLPITIKAKKAVINVQNNDNYCFAWAITSALYPPTGLPQRVSSYPHFSDTCMDYNNLEFPVGIREIPRFEEHNNISINLYGINSWFNGEAMIHDIVTLSICQRKRDRHVNLLLVTDDYGNNHFCWIKNLSRLITSQSSQNEHEKYICEGCLIYFTSAINLIRHQNDDCTKVRAILPSMNMVTDKYGNMEQENILKFKNF